LHAHGASFSIISSTWRHAFIHMEVIFHDVYILGPFMGFLLG
jgi:hypothetical protein